MRPRVKNPDGSISTVLSFSTNIDGKEVLLPLVSDDGRIVSEDEAIRNYERTGRYLGKFNTPEEADAYAERLQNEQESIYAKPDRGLLGSDVVPSLEQAVMQVESGGNPAAVSSKGAVGTMQTMPGTLRDPGYGVVPARDQSPAEQERVGKDYLGAMLRQYADPRAALAAYNWGPGNVDNALRAAGATWTPCLHLLRQRRVPTFRRCLHRQARRGRRELLVWKLVSDPIVRFVRRSVKLRLATALVPMAHS